MKGVNRSERMRSNDEKKKKNKEVEEILDESRYGFLFHFITPALP